MPQIRSLPRDIRFAELGAGLGDVLGSLGGIAGGLRRQQREEEQQQYMQEQSEQRHNMIAQALEDQGYPREYAYMDPKILGLFLRESQQSRATQQKAALEQSKQQQKEQEEKRAQKEFKDLLVRQYNITSKQADIISKQSPQTRMEYLKNIHKHPYQHAISSWFSGEEELPTEEQQIREQQQFASETGERPLALQQQLPQEEGVLFRLPRQITAALTKGLSSYAGVPGELLGAITSPIQQWRQGKLPSREEFEAMTKNLPPDMKRQLERSYGEMSEESARIPTAEDINRFVSKAFPESYLEPRSKGEQFIQELATDVGSLMFPFLGKTQKFGAKLLKSGVTSTVGNIAKELSKKAGATPGVQEGVKLGTMILTSAGLDSDLISRANHLYNKAKEIGGVKKITTAPLKQALRNVEKDFVLKGAEGAPAREMVNEVLNKVGYPLESPTIALNEIAELKKDLSDFYVKAKNMPRAQAQIEKIRSSFNDFIKKSPLVPKDYAKTLSEADQIWKGVSQSQKVNDFIVNQLKKRGSYAGLLGILNPAYAAKVAGGLAGTYGLAQGGLVLKNILSNPSIRKEYLKTFAVAARQNVPVFLKQANKLQKTIAKNKR